MFTRFEKSSHVARPSFNFWLLRGAVKEALVKDEGKQNTYPRGKKMEKQDTQNIIPTQLRAVLTIVNADPELRKKALPFVNIERQEVNWTEIFRHDLGSGRRAALVWAKALYRDQTPFTVDPFDRALSMDDQLRRAVADAIAIRWGLI